MALTFTQLVAAWTAATDGIAPDDLTTAVLSSLAVQIASGTGTDTQALTYIINNADKTTAIANLSYLFFTDKTPTKAGLDYLVNSTVNANDLNDPYYAKFGLENRAINFAANLGILGEGAAAFAATYGSMSFAAYVGAIYEEIVGSAFATLAGINPILAIADIVSRQAALTQIARDAKMITATSTAAQIDLALKAATAGYLIGEAMKADVGQYAAASNNFTYNLIQGTATFNADIVTTYAALGGGLGSPVVPYMVAPPPPVNQTLRLTIAADTLTGGAGNDAFNASDLAADGVTRAAVFNLADNLNGAGGTDTLTITSVTGADYTLPLATVAAIEIGSITGDKAVTANTSTWTGLTQLSVATGGSATVTAPATSTVAVTTAALGLGTITVNGGSNISVSATGANANGAAAVAIGATTVPTGTVTVNLTTTTAGGAAGTVTVKGGTSVNINQTAVNPFNTTLTHGAVTVTGTASTTAVTATATPTATAGAGTSGVTAGTVTITDVNGGGASTTNGTITTVTADTYTTIGISDNALTTLSLTRGSGNILIDNSSSLVTVTNKTLNLTANGLTGGTLDDADIYTKLNVTTAGAASTLANITLGALTTLTVAGTQVLTLISTAGMSALTTATISGSAGLTANLSGATVTAVDTSGSTGTTTVTVDTSKATFTGGAGVDKVTSSAVTTGKAISLGGGDDIFVLGASTTPTATIDGGGGTGDTLSMTAAFYNANAAGILTKITGFERVELTAPGNTTIDLTTLGLVNYVLTSGGNTLTLDKLAAGGTLALNGTGTVTTLGAQNFGGTTDTLNLVLTSGAGAMNVGTINGPGAETLAITTADTQTTPTNPLYTAVVVDAATKGITVTGNAGLSLVQASTALTSVDASGISAGAFTWTSGALAAAAVVKGSATGVNTVTFSAATGGAVTYTGGTGNDLITAANGKDNGLTLGAGNNSVTGTTGNFTITALGGNDTVTLSTGNNNVNLGDGTNGFTATNGNNTYTGGSGADTVNLGNGANTVNLGDGANIFNGGNGGTTYTGGSGADTVTVTGGTNTIGLGDGANDFTGGTGVDTVTGGTGTDRLNLSAGADNLTGGAGVDTYVLSAGVLASADITTISDFTTGVGGDKVEATKASMNGTAGTYVAGAAGSLVAATAYGVIVLTGTGYANVGAAEDAVAAQSTSATGALVVYFDTTLNKAQMFYDADIDVDNNLAAGAAVATFNNITVVGSMTGFDTTNFALL